MKKIQLSKLSIAYRENEGTGSPVLLIHGNSCSSRAFEKQLSNLNQKVVAIDLPGHGDSDHLPDHTHYNIPAYAKVVAEAAEKLGIEEAVVVGWSLGGHIALEVVKWMPKAKGFVIYGTPPISFPPAMEEAFLPNPAVGVGFTPDVNEEQATSFANAFFKNGKSPVVPYIEDILKTDGNARAGLGASITPDGFEDEIAIVGNMKVPLAILHGADESLVNGDYLKKLDIPKLWKGNVQMVENAGHAAHWDNSEAFNALIDAFCNDVN